MYKRQLQGGVTRILKDRLAWVTDVVGGVDDSIDPEDSMSLGCLLYTSVVDALRAQWGLKRVGTLPKWALLPMVWVEFEVERPTL